MTKPGPEHAVQLTEEHDLSAFQRPMGKVPERVQSALDRGVSEADAKVFDTPNILLNQSAGGDGLTDAVLRLPNGQLVVACLTEMPDVSSAMWDCGFPGTALRASATGSGTRKTTLLRRWIETLAASRRSETDGWATPHTSTSSSAAS